MSPLADTKPSIALITDGGPVELILNRIGEPPCPPPSSRALTFRLGRCSRADAEQHPPRSARARVRVRLARRPVTVVSHGRGRCRRCVPTVLWTPDSRPSTWQNARLHRSRRPSAPPPRMDRLSCPRRSPVSGNTWALRGHRFSIRRLSHAYPVSSQDGRAWLESPVPNTRMCPPRLATPSTDVSSGPARLSQTCCEL
jgi:hypothetical protein